MTNVFVTSSTVICVIISCIIVMFILLIRK